MKLKWAELKAAGRVMAGSDRARQPEGGAGCRAAHPHECAGHDLVMTRVAAAACQDRDAHRENGDGAALHVTWTLARARRLQPAPCP